MLNAFDRFFELPDDTKVFCGHEYTVKNLEFGLLAEPSNEDIKQFHKFYSDHVAQGYFTVPGLLRNEKLYNVFMRCRDPIMHSLIGSDDPIKCMAFLREFKNTGERPKI